MDKTRNAEGIRSPLRSSGNPQTANLNPTPGQVAPLLEQLMMDYAATGLPPAYLPKDELLTAPNPTPESAR